MNKLNETYGVIEFDNLKYHKLLENACQKLVFNFDNAFSINIFDDICIDNNISNLLSFNKTSIAFDKSLTWLKTLNIYFTNNKIFEQITGGEALSTSLPSILDNDFYKQTEKDLIDVGSIFLYINERLEILMITT